MNCPVRPRLPSNANDAWKKEMAANSRLAWGARASSLRLEVSLLAIGRRLPRPAFTQNRQTKIQPAGAILARNPPSGLRESRLSYKTAN
jgi:hypothetical protein